MADEARRLFCCEAIRSSFEEMAVEVAERHFSPLPEPFFGRDRVVVVLSLISGDESMRGRVLFEGDTAQMRDIAETMNGEPLSETTELYFYVGEFVNIFCGHAVTTINNAYRGIQFRLTPPAIFAGTNMDVFTPSVAGRFFAYGGERGSLRLDVGFEGV